MRLRPLFAILVVLTAGLASGPLQPVHVLAQEEAEMPPLPRPRPDPDALPTDGGAPVNQVTPATDAIDAATAAPQAVVLTARITPDGAPIPEGLVWRIFESEPDSNGELALLAKSESGEASIELEPGQYVVHVAYGRAQSSETVTIQPGQGSIEMVLGAGALRLNAAVTGEVPIPPGLLAFDIYTDQEEVARGLIAEAVSPNEIVTLNSGTYHVVSRFGEVNATVRADLRVEPGQITDATLYHHAAQISFKLVSEQGGEAIADVEWTVKTADGTTVFSNLGAFPTTVLAEGDYLVLAKLGETVYNREFQVQPGPPREIEVLTSVY
ncbi:hypothetical protein ACFSX5_01275 [Devosia albogilva]|uniref:Carboxypeptidase regulatory-like domain-containing protein n=1 Tax=Devosia albogilva TaxID=429726 RepID=A0ABW5QGF5_9HYPH